ncbi:hypothetical protein SAMN04488543_3843 [Friedmanniella luteola]|uniref:Uncharacterized protein n=1 Tax=Friedmanniella luteola TaxID=546871 RepID=A0A1H1ZL05_9ACTN|nr:hypothetical protein [Friedmanniella luteola]SDT34333.1 hypothetical protein SAMN04488543_3843 [Friedmanniella luteola]
MSADDRRAAVFGLVLALLVVAVGVAGVVAGEADDSPGLQLLGGLLVIAAVAGVARAARLRRRRARARARRP